MEERIIGTARMKSNNVPVVAKITNTRVAILPDGTRKPIPEDKYERLLEQIEKVPEESNDNPVETTPPAEHLDMKSKDDKIADAMADFKAKEDAIKNTSTKAEKEIPAVPSAPPAAPPAPVKPKKAESKRVEPTDTGPIMYTANSNTEPVSPPEKPFIFTADSAENKDNGKVETSKSKTYKDNDYNKRPKSSAVWIGLFFGLLVVFIFVVGGFGYLVATSSPILENILPPTSITEEVTPAPESTPVPESTPEPEPEQDNDIFEPAKDLPEATQQEINEAETILIIARIVTPEGIEKEVTIGYFAMEGAQNIPEEITGADNASQTTSNPTSETIENLSEDVIELSYEELEALVNAGDVISLSTMAIPAEGRN